MPKGRKPEPTGRNQHPKKPSVLPKRKSATPRSLAKLPSSTLTAAFNYLQPSWREYINYVEISAKEGDPEMKRLLDVHTTLTPRERQYITPEQLCERSNVEAADLVAEVCRQLYKLKHFQSSVIAAVNEPLVVAKTAKSALGNSKQAGFDRTNFLKGVGFLPTPKPSIFNINTQPQAQLPTSEMPKLLSHADEMSLLDAGEAEIVPPQGS